MQRLQSLRSRVAFLAVGAALGASVVLAGCGSDTGGGAAVQADAADDLQLSDAADASQGDAQPADAPGDAAPLDTADPDAAATDASADAPGEVVADAAADTSGPSWTVFTLQTGGFCAPGSDCFSTWTVGPDGTLAMKKGGTSSQGALSSSDLVALHSRIDGPAFLAKMKDGFSCGLPPTDISYSFSYALFGVSYQQDVTGCQLSGGADGALVQSIVALLKAY